MKYRPWRLLNPSVPETLPNQHQDIWFTTAEGEGSPFGDIVTARADLSFSLWWTGVLEANPDALIIWQPVPTPPKPTGPYKVLYKTYCTASAFQARRCEYNENGDCLRIIEEGSCPSQRPIQTICFDRGGDAQ